VVIHVVLVIKCGPKHIAAIEILQSVAHQIKVGVVGHISRYAVGNLIVVLSTQLVV
jgi:hypothetical protein